MFPDSPILGNSDSLAFTLKGYSNSWPFTYSDNCGSFYDEMVNKLFVASTTRNKIPPKKARGRLRQSEAFFALACHAIVAKSHLICSYPE